MNEIMHLANKISVAATNYYLGSPIMSDEEFDRLVDTLRKLDPNHKVLNSVGWGLDLDKSALTKVEHPYNVLAGLPKSKVQNDTLLNSLGVVKVNTPKLDGLSIEVCYVDGLFDKAITRGNGTVGLDVSNKIKHLVPLVLPFKLTMSVRGEFVLSYDKFIEFYSDSPSPRNVAAGVLNRQHVDRNEITRFNFVAYKIIACSKLQLESNVASVKTSAIQFLSDVGFEVVPYIKTNTPMTYEETYKILNESMDQNYPLDGIVSSNPEETIKFLDNEIYVIDYQDEVAYKTITETAVTTVTEISWNLTRTGKLIPTVLYEPVELSGATLARALGHNAKYIADNRIDVGAKIEIVRSGEVIPYILGVEEPSPSGVGLPAICPSCGGYLKWKGVDLICDNEDCISKEIANVHHWIHHTSPVHGVGGSIISAIIDAFDITRVEDLYEVTDSDITKLYARDGIGHNKVELVRDLFFELNKHKDLVAFLVGLNLNGLGWSSAKKLACSEFYNLLIKKQRVQITHYLLDNNHKGVMRKTKEAIIDNLDRIFNLMNYVSVYYFEEEVAEPLTNDDELLPICVTGKLENFSNRKDLFNQLSHKVVETDIKKCKYLVCNSDKGSSKSKYANANNIPIISEHELLELIGELKVVDANE